MMAPLSCLHPGTVSLALPLLPRPAMDQLPEDTLLIGIIGAEREVTGYFHCGISSAPCVYVCTFQAGL